MTKQFYETPTTKTLVVRFGGNIMLIASQQSNSANSGYDNDYDMGEI